MDDNLIIIGDRDAPLMEFGSCNIVSCVCTQEMHPTGEELPISTAEIVIKTAGFVGLFCPNDYPDGMEGADGAAVVCKEAGGTALIDIPIYTKIWIYRNENLIGKYYVGSITQQSANEYQISCIDWAGVLDRYVFDGACFYSTGWTLAQALNAVRRDAYAIASVGFITDIYYPDTHPITDIWRSFVIDDDYLSNSLRLTNGFIKGGGSLREYLQVLFFDYNIMARQDGYGDIVLSAYPAEAALEISAANTYSGASRAQKEYVSTISVTEYEYFSNPSPTRETIYDTSLTGTANDVTVLHLDEPVAAFYVSGNFSFAMKYNGGAFLCLKGFGKVEIEKYSSTARRISIRETAISSAIDGADVSVDNTGITQANSDLLLEKLKGYYFSGTWENSVATIEEHTIGVNLDFTDAVGRNTSGFVAAKSTALSGIARNDLTIHSGFTPTSAFGYSNAIVLSGSGTFTVPDSVFESDNPMIRVILIGGGQGGASGCKGMNGKVGGLQSTGSSYTSQDYISISNEKGQLPTVTGFEYGKTGAAGLRGDDGAGGKILIRTIENPARTYAYNCGAGGAGAAGGNTSETENTPGALGGVTTFGSLSSASGTSENSGYLNPITNIRYALGGNESRKYEAANDICGIDSAGSIVRVDSMAGGAPYVLAYGKTKEWEWMQHTSAWVNNSLMLSQFSFSAGKNSIYKSLTPLQSNICGLWGTSPAKWAMGGGGGGAGAGNDGTDGSNGTATRFGRGGNGGDSSWKPPTVISLKPDAFGFGGIGGFGGGGGGHTGFGFGTGSIAAGTPGQGGAGGPGGDGSPGCVIVLY